MKPRVVSSRCLGFENCRYDGHVIRNGFVESLRSHVEFTTVCPEVQIGLEVPRKRIRVVSSKEGLRLIQPETDMDFTEQMVEFADGFLDSLGEVDGFIMKSASPSCGLKDVKMYTGARNAPSRGRGAGFFGARVLERFSHLAVEDEARLGNDRIREHFLTKLFTLAGFRESRSRGRVRDLVDFHSRNKMLFLAYNQTGMRKLGRIVANEERREPSELFHEYGEELGGVLARGPRTGAGINTMMHALGRFKDRISPGEKALFLDLLDEYRRGIVCMASPLSLLRSWAVGHGDEYLMDQTFLEPFPGELLVPQERERDYWG